MNGPLAPLYRIVERDVVPERWRHLKTWPSQSRPDGVWGEGIAHYASRATRPRTPAARRVALVRLVAWALAAIEDIDRRGGDRAEVDIPFDHLPEGVTR